MKSVKRFIFALFLPVLIPLYYVSFLYLNNIDEASLDDTIYPLVWSFVIIAVCFSAFMIITRNIYKSSILSGIFFILFLNYKYIETLIKIISYRIRYWHIFPAVFLTFVIIAAFVCHLKDVQIIKQIVGIATFVFLFLIVLNVIMNIGGIMQSLSGSQANTTANNTITEKVSGQPNVYYIILDEYSNFDILEKYYGEDNSEFYQFLIEKGFTVSEHSQNEIANLLTLYITTNYLNLDYVVFQTDTDSQQKAHQLRIDPPLFQQFYDHGYSIHHYAEAGVSIQWNGSYGEVGKSTSTTMDGRNFSILYFSNFAFYPFLSTGSDEYQRQLRYDAMDFLDRNVTGKNQSNFVYVHSKGAHEPFVFTEDGSTVPETEWGNVGNPRYYLGQYKFVTKLTQEAICNILEKDPECIIILMTDHSMRKTQNELGEVIVSNEDKTTILNAVYYRGEPFEEINNQSGVNTLRLVLDRLFNSNLGIIEVPR